MSMAITNTLSMLEIGINQSRRFKKMSDFFKDLGQDFKDLGEKVEKGAKEFGESVEKNGIN